MSITIRMTILARKAKDGAIDRYSYVGPIGAVGKALRLSKRGSRVQIPAASMG